MGLVEETAMALDERGVPVRRGKCKQLTLDFDAIAALEQLEAVRKLMYNKSMAYKSLKVWQEIDCPVCLFLALPGI
jgi:hypothetical protein